jgi:hypothetical protein
MWTSKNRARYDGSRLRYPSDLTDEEWALIEHLIPPAKRGGTKRTVNLREIANGLMYILAPAANGARFRRICRPARPCTIISVSGVGTEHSTASIRPFTPNAGRELNGRRLPRQPSSTARA